jgi:hypothetical protein
MFSPSETTMGARMQAILWSARLSALEGSVSRSDTRCRACPRMPASPRICTRDVPATLQGASEQTTIHPFLQGLYREALFRTRTGDPLLTMEVLYQLS